MNSTTHLDVFNTISYQIIGGAYNVHSELGPGLLESAYETCLEYELLQAGLQVERQVSLPLSYKGIKLDAGYRIDLLVEESIILEVKTVDSILPIHKAQLMTYLKLTDLKLGLLLNFNVSRMKQGITRIMM